MEEKKADNRIISYKEKINNVDNRIDDAKGKLRDIDDLDELFSLIKQNMGHYLESLNHSVKGKNVTHKLDDMSVRNNNNYSRMQSRLEDERIATKKKLTKLYDEKEELMKKQKQENQDNNKEEKK